MRDTRDQYPPEYDEADSSDFPHTIGSLAKDLGLGTWSEAVRAHDRHGMVTLGVKVALGEWIYGDEAKKLSDETPIERVSVSGIAWDDSDWECTADGEPTRQGVDDACRDFDSALADHDAETETENTP